MENLEKYRQFELGLKGIEFKMGLNYSILNYIEYTGIEDRPVLFKGGLDGRVRDEVIVMGNLVFVPTCI